MRPIVFFSRSLPERKREKSRLILQQFNPHMVVASHESDPAISLIVFNPKTELGLKRRPDCMAVTYDSLRQMQAGHIDPFTFTPPDKIVRNLALMNASVAFVNTQSTKRLISLVRSMCGTVDESVLPSTSYVITDDKTATQTYSVPLVHTTWIEALVKNPSQRHTPYLLPLRPSNSLSQQKPIPRFGPINPLTLTQAGKHPRRAIDVCLSQTRIPTAFLASPVRPSLRLERVEPRCSAAAAEVEDRPVTPETPKGLRPVPEATEKLSPTLRRLCTALMAPPIKLTEPKVPSSPRSIEELSRFTQAVNDEDDKVEFDIGYEQPAEGGYAARGSQEKDPLLDLFRASQTFSQTPRDEWP
jgi:hypothetical protein